MFHSCLFTRSGHQSEQRCFSSCLFKPIVFSLDDLKKPAEALWTLSTKTAWPVSRSLSLVCFRFRDWRFLILGWFCEFREDPLLGSWKEEPHRPAGCTKRASLQSLTQTHSKLAYFVYKKRKGGNQQGNALAAVVFQTKTKGGVPKLHRVWV